jgi:hypothetical protein
MNMKKFIVSLILGSALPIFAIAASPAAINLGTAGNFAILSKTGISTTGTTKIVGDIGVSPVAASYITGFALTLPAASSFSTSALITGKVYASDYANPTPSNLTTAVLDMQTAYTDGAGRAPTVTELGAGNIGGLTLTPGVYKWGTGVTIPTDVTLSGSGNDIWIFQIAQNLNISSATKIVLAGGAQASNIFWVVAGQTTIGTTAIFNGNILDQTAIVLNTGATLNGRALAQTAVTLDSNAVTAPTSSSIVQPAPSCDPLPIVSGCTVTATVVNNACVYKTVCSAPVPTPCPLVYINGVIQHSCDQIPATPISTQTSNGSTSSNTNTTSNTNAALQAQIKGLLTTFQSLQAQANHTAPEGPVPTSAFGQQVRTIANNLGNGSRDNNVAILQQFLISQNKGPAAQALARAGATAYFGTMTRAALAEFQANVGISPALGNFGPITREYLRTNY